MDIMVAEVGLPRAISDANSGGRLLFGLGGGDILGMLLGRVSNNEDFWGFLWRLTGGSFGSADDIKSTSIPLKALMNSGAE